MVVGLFISMVNEDLCEQRRLGRVMFLTPLSRASEVRARKRLGSLNNMHTSMSQPCLAGNLPRYPPSLACLIVCCACYGKVLQAIQECTVGFSKM
jgi:hypothetical protein